jgi:chemotaxis signal transduction protein
MSEILGSETSARPHDRAAGLRAAFDRAFAEPLRLDAPATENLLAIRIGTEPCALRLSEIAGLFADRKITRVPGSAAALLGLAGFRGALVPVYSLQILVGQAPVGQAPVGQAPVGQVPVGQVLPDLAGAKGGAPTPRWLVVAAAAPVALAFEAFEGQLRLTPEEIIAAPPRAAQWHASLGGGAREFVRMADFAGPILHLPSLLAAIATAGGVAAQANARDKIEEER